METTQFRWTHEGEAMATGVDAGGTGRLAILLPAMSSISTRREMHPLGRLLAADLRCQMPDWPGFGLDAPAGGGRLPPALTPGLMLGFLRAFVAAQPPGSLVVVAAGHSAAYVMTVAGEMPGRFSHIALVAPTWRGPLPTAMGAHRRPLWHKVRRAVEAPVVGQALFRLNVSGPVMRGMMKSHVYADEAFLTDEHVAAKMAVTRRAGARFATAAFVTGELDLVREREDFAALFAPPGLPPVLAVIGEATPRKSRAEMEALAALPQIRTARIPGSLAAHEEHPEAVAAALRAFVGL